jgi:hypothetical protein
MPSPSPEAQSSKTLTDRGLTVIKNISPKFMPNSDPLKQKASAHKHYLANTARVKARASEWTKKNRTRIRHFIWGYKSSIGCQHCGIDDWRVLDFHHLGDKERPVSNTGSWSLLRVLKEIAKCQVLCANCHRIETSRVGEKVS